MTLLAYGISHHTAPIAIREKLAFQEATLPNALINLIQQPTIQEAAILSTCNRTEIYATTDNPCVLQHWLATQKTLSFDALTPYVYTHRAENAVQHMMRVASGLDSMVLGEPEVFGQMKQAYALATTAGTTGEWLNHVFPAVFTASKQIRTDTDICAHPISFAYTVSELAQKTFQDIKTCRALLIGAGKTMTLIATHLRSQQIKSMTVANRTFEKTQTLADTFHANAIGLQDVPTALKNADIVITATTSPTLILTKHMIEDAIKQREKKPLLLIDFSVPRNIDAAVTHINHVLLYNLDDLQVMIENNLKNRASAAIQAEKIIALHTSTFFQRMRVFHVRQVIARYREQLSIIRDAELKKALKKLAGGDNPETVLKQFGTQLVNKVMHHPTMKLREAASESECEFFQRMQHFFKV